MAVGGDAASGPDQGWSRARAAATRSAVRLRLHPEPDFDRACARLERELQALPPLLGMAVTLEAARSLTPPDLRRLEELLLDRHGAQLLQVVEAVEPPPAEGAPGPATATPREPASGRRPRPRTGGVARARATPPATTARAAHEQDAAGGGAPDGGGPGGEGHAGSVGGGRGEVSAHGAATGSESPHLPSGRPTPEAGARRADRASARTGRPRPADSGSPARHLPLRLARVAGARVHGSRSGTGSPTPDGTAHSGDALSLPAAGFVPAMLVKRTLRSGQRVRFAGHVVVLGDVNPGAEVVAAGDIVVMGTLRGVAHAGATGGEDAIIAAFRLLPTQIRVAGVIGRAPDGRTPRPDAPEVARVRDGVLVVERYVPQ